MRLIAIVRKDKATKHITYTDYNTKKAMREDLKANGYTVIAILTSKQITDIKKQEFTYGIDKEYKEYVKQQL